AELVACGASDGEIERVLCAVFWRDKLRRKDYIARTIARAREDAPATFREESRAIGEGPQEVDLLPRQYDLASMLAEAVFIREGSQVALRGDSRVAWSFPDFENRTAASVVHGGKGRPAKVA